MKRIILPAIIATLIFSGCNKWLDVKPSDQVNDTQLFGDVDGVRSAINGLYQTISTPELYGRELTWGFNSAIGQDYNSTKMTAALTQAMALNFIDVNVKSVTSGIWAKAFNVIANSNKILQEVKDKEIAFFPNGLTEKNMILGEAMAMRALMHFEVLRIFAPSPISDPAGKFMPYQTAYPVHFGTPMATAEVIRSIAADLDSAQKLVAANDTIYNRNGISSISSRLNGGSTQLFYAYRLNRLNYVAIHGLLARVYMYGGDRVNAKREAEYVYKEFGPSGRNKWFLFTTETNSKGVNRYTKFADDILFAGYDPNEVLNITTYKKTVTNATFNLAEAPYWFPATERDYRANIVEADFTSAKWLETVSTAQNVPIQNTILPVIRLSEMYYIYAECLYEESNTTDALKVLNEIRIARGRTTVFSDAGRDGFYAELFAEYRREFVAEGQTVFAHKRLNRFMMVGATKRIEVDGRFTVPLPDGELNF